MSSQKQRTTAPAGRVDGPGIMFGMVALVLAVVLEMLGLFKGANSTLLTSLLDPVFHGDEPQQLGIPLMVIVTGLFCIGLSYAVLDSSCSWRRCILGVSAVVVVLAMVPALAVWGYYFPPMMPVVGIVWAWFCTVIYASNHTMPCDSARSVHSVRARGTASPVRNTAPAQKKTTQKPAQKTAKKIARKSTKKVPKKRPEKRPEKQKSEKQSAAEPAPNSDDKYKPRD
ncbi:MAG: hypothetical protein ACPGUY_08540 [Akkermansiaceae bacterium]